MSLKHNFENGGAGGGAQNFVLLPWKMSNIVDNNVLMLIELSSRICDSAKTNKQPLEGRCLLRTSLYKFAVTVAAGGQ